MAKRRPKNGKRAKKRSRWRKVLYVVEIIVLLGVLGGGTYALYDYVIKSGTYNVHTIRVKGTKVVAEEEVALASTITTSDNVVFLDTSSAKQNIEAIPYIKTCKITRQFPDMVIINVVEREPVAALLVENHIFEIDSDCVILQELEMSAQHAGPLISNLSNLGIPEPGMELDLEELDFALTVWDAFSQVSMSKDVTVSELYIASDEPSLTVLMFCNELAFEIRWGRGDSLLQAKRLNTLWEEKDKKIECTQYLDLRFGSDLACK